ncbi:ABC transporter ATP-binding protein [Butyrivibrio fibrisolvens]|uniref:ABC transporter ATP-binding protein n=1 Tax=Butyrivibrio fibrisolvens TaxID=831 RepID=UPI00041C1379|nr:ABC transporter ATP-binding protein [Butyrivibrio fibrisolvens]
MNESIIEVNGVSMRFNLEEEHTDTLKEYFMKMLKHQLRFNEFYALKNVSFEIKKGDAVALVGRNGSGKSTMLKIIAGILYPTTGTVNVKGTIAPLIELGAGFNEELTARENIFLNGAVLGYDRAFMGAHFDEIIEFAELQDFVDVPIKNFSSGMAARLGFAIATIVKADILVVDEVLAVGDFKFQEKCENRMKELMSNGTTVLFVSHSMDKVKGLCNKSIWIDHGKMMMYGDTEEVCDKYMASYE